MIRLKKGTRAYSVNEVKKMIDDGDCSPLNVAHLDAVSPWLMRTLLSDKDLYGKWLDASIQIDEKGAEELDHYLEDLFKDEEKVQNQILPNELFDSQTIPAICDTENLEDTKVVNCFDDEGIENPYVNAEFNETIDTEHLHLYELKNQLCPIHGTDLKELNVRAQYEGWKKYGLIVYGCEKCRHLYISENDFEIIKPYLDSKKIDYTYFKEVQN